MARIVAEWQGREYDHVPKSADWYWVLGIIAIAGAIASGLFGNYLLSILIIIAALALALHAAKEPPIHRFRLLDQGLLIGEELHPFDQMVSFCLLEDEEDDRPALLSIRTKHWLSPHLVIPLEGVRVEIVYAHFLERIEEDEHEPNFVDVVAGWLGF